MNGRHTIDCQKKNESINKYVIKQERESGLEMMMETEFEKCITTPLKVSGPVYEISFACFEVLIRSISHSILAYLNGVIIWERLQTTLFGFYVTPHNFNHEPGSSSGFLTVQTGVRSGIFRRGVARTESGVGHQASGGPSPGTFAMSMIGYPATNLLTPTH